MDRPETHRYNAASVGRAKPTATGAAVTSLVRALGAYGVDGHEIARRAGVAREVLTQADARVESDTLDKFMAMAVSASGDPAFPLFFAQQHRAINRDLYFAMAASDTLGDAWVRKCRYRAMLSEHLDFEMTRERGTLSIAFGCPEPEVGRWHPTDVVAATNVLEARAFTMDATAAPISVALRRPEPVARDPYDELFRCALRFGCERNTIVWDAELASRSLPLASGRIASQSESVLIAYLERLDALRLTSRLRRLLVTALPDGPPRRDVAARKLGLSARSLARGLASEDTSYSQVLDDVRASLAREYLRAGCNVTEVAFMVGFSETSAFCRAFRRWTGTTPTAYIAATP